MASSEKDNYKQDIEDLRKRFFDGFTKEKLDEFEEADLSRFRNDDSYCENFLKHNEGNVEKALHMVKETFKWRKEFGVQDLSEDSIDINVRSLGTLHRKHQDKPGNPIIMMVLRNYKRDSKLSTEQRRAAIYVLENCLRTSPTAKVSFIFDMQDAGISNYDLSFSMFLTNILAKYYPNILEHVLVYDLPTLFYAMWKLLLPFIPKNLRPIVKFVNKDTIKQYVDEEFLPISMGGQDTTEYVYTPGEWTT